MATSQGSEPGMSAEEAARTLAGLERYEERLTAKAFGITMMAFGIAGPAIGLTYALAEEWFVEEIGQPWWLSLLWVPWIAAAVLLAAAVWKAHAISLNGQGADRGSRWYSVAFTLLYLVLLGVASAIAGAAGWDPASPHVNAFVLGVFTLILAAFFLLRYGNRPLVTPIFGAGLVVLAVAAATAFAGVDGVPATLLLALTGLVAWVGAGSVIVTKG